MSAGQNVRNSARRSAGSVASDPGKPVDRSALGSAWATSATRAARSGAIAIETSDGSAEVLTVTAADSTGTVSTCACAATPVGASAVTQFINSQIAVLALPDVAPMVFTTLVSDTADTRWPVPDFGRKWG